MKNRKKKKLIIALIVLLIILLIPISVFAYFWFFYEVPVGTYEYEAEFIDNESENYIVELDGVKYYERELKTGWFYERHASEENAIYIFNQGNRRNYNVRAFFLNKENKPEYGIAISEYHMCLFPDEIYYPDFVAAPPDSIHISATWSDFYVYNLTDNYELVVNIANNIYSSELISYLPTELTENPEISKIDIYFHWDDLNYYFKQNIWRNFNEYSPQDFRITITEDV